MFLKRERREALTGYLFILPSFASIAIFLIGPIIFGIVMSFYQWLLGRPPVYIGLTNYFKLIRDPIFWLSVRHTLKFALIYVPAIVFFSLIVAVLVHSLLRRGKELFQFVLFIPVVASLVVAAIMWKWLYHGDFGLINYFLNELGFEKVNWLGDKKTVIPAIAIVSIWKNYGYYMVIYLAGLVGIPEQYYEVARIDGATRVQQFIYITLPLLKRISLLVVVLSTILAFQAFDWIFVMTNMGGPAYAGYTIDYLVYVTGLKDFRMGYASSIAFILLLIVLFVSFLEISFEERGE
jgi:multiple sugar transport system permease protein